MYAVQEIELNIKKSVYEFSYAQSTVTYTSLFFHKKVTQWPRIQE